LDYVKIANSAEWKATLDTVYMLQRVNLDLALPVKDNETDEEEDSNTTLLPRSDSLSGIGSSSSSSADTPPPPQPPQTSARGSKSKQDDDSKQDSLLSPRKKRNAAKKKQKKDKRKSNKDIGAAATTTENRGLTREERLAFFLNVYNILVIHGIIWYGWPDNEWERMNFYQACGYVIGGLVYSLNDIETGILRGNKQKAGSLGVPFTIEDVRKNYMIPGGESKIHFVLWRGTGRYGADLMAFSPEALEAELNAGVREFLQDERKGLKVVVASKLGITEIWLSKLFAYYYVDFGETEKDVLKWLVRAMGIEIPEKEKIKIKHLDWSWKHSV